MRVVVCPDSIGPLSSAEAARRSPAGWAGHEVVRRPSGEAGGGFVAALAAQWGVEVTTAVVDGRLVTAASTADRLALAVPGEPDLGPIPVDGDVVAAWAWPSAPCSQQYRPRTVWLDLVSDDVHDGGAGFRSALGDSLDGIDLVGVVPESERTGCCSGCGGSPRCVVARSGRIRPACWPSMPGSPELAASLGCAGPAGRRSLRRRRAGRLGARRPTGHGTRGDAGRRGRARRCGRDRLHLVRLRQSRWRRRGVGSSAGRTAALPVRGAGRRGAHRRARDAHHGRRGGVRPGRRRRRGHGRGLRALAVRVGRSWRW